jgi:hypothetical protein
MDLLYKLKMLTIALVTLVAAPAIADLADELEELEGYLIFATETIEDYEGCDYGKTIKFQSGGSVICDDYEYGYGYYEDAVILVKSAVLPKYGKIISCKMAVEDDILDINCAQYMRRSLAIRKIACQDVQGNHRVFCDRKLRVLNAIVGR